MFSEQYERAANAHSSYQTSVTRSEDHSEENSLPKVRSLRRFAPFLVLFSNIARAASQWVLLWFFAILGGAEVVGEYSIALAIATPIFIVLDLSIRNVFVTLKTDVIFGQYLRLRLLTSGLAFVVLIGTSFFVAIPPGVLLLIGAVKAVDSLLELAYGALQKRSDLYRIAWTSMLNSGLTVAFGVAAFALSRSVELSLVGSLLGSAITVVIVFAPLLVSGNGQSSKKQNSHGLRAVIRAGIPSGLAFASVSLLTYLPVYFLSSTESARIVGIFAVLAYFPVIANLLYASVQQVTLNNFVASYEARGNRGLALYATRILTPLLLLGIGLGTGTFLLGDWFIQGVFGAEFAVPPAAVHFVAVSLAILPIVYVSGAILLTRNRYGIQFITGGLALATSAIVGTFMLAGFNLESAAVLVLVGTSARAVLSGSAAIWSLKSRRDFRETINSAS